jgi:hypothetical protein
MHVRFPADSSRGRHCCNRHHDRPTQQDGSLVLRVIRCSLRPSCVDGGRTNTVGRQVHPPPALDVRAAYVPADEIKSSVNLACRATRRRHHMWRERVVASCCWREVVSVPARLFFAARGRCLGQRLLPNILARSGRIEVRATFTYGASVGSRPVTMRQSAHTRTPGSPRPCDTSGQRRARAPPRAGCSPRMASHVARTTVGCCCSRQAVRVSAKQQQQIGAPGDTERLPSKLATRVRFPSPAPLTSRFAAYQGVRK